MRLVVIDPPGCFHVSCLLATDLGTAILLLLTNWDLLSSLTDDSFQISVLFTNKPFDVSVGVWAVWMVRFIFDSKDELLLFSKLKTINDLSGGVLIKPRSSSGVAGLRLL